MIAYLTKKIKSFAIYFTSYQWRSYAWKLPHYFVYMCEIV
jgi:hypothetical protein